MWRGLAALVAVVVAWSGVAPTAARAEGATWWLPSTWVTAAAGDLLSVIDALQGGSVDVSTTAGIDIGALYGGLPANLHGRWHYVAELAGTSSPAGWPVLVWAAQGGDARCWPGSDANTPTSDCSAPQRPVLGSTAQGFNVQVVCESGVTGAAGWTDSSLTATARASCGSVAGVESILIPARQSASYGYAYPEMRVWLDAPELQVVLTCRSTSDGVDTDVSESSATGVAPSPSCPAGSVPIRVRVYKGGELVQDTAIDQGALENWWTYIRDPMPWDWSGNAGDCRVTSTYDPSMILVMPPDVCQDASERGPLAGDGGDQEPDCAGDLLCSVVLPGFATVKKLLGGIATAVGKVVTGVKSVVDSVVESAKKIVEGVGSAIGSAADRIVKAIKDLQEAMENGFGNIGDEGGDGGEGGCSGADCPGGPGDVGVGGMDPGDIAGKFAPWTDALAGLIGVFDRPDPGCMGPVVRADFKLGELGTEPFVAYPFAACAEPMKTVAAVVKAGLTLLFIVGGVLAVVRILGSSFGVGAIGGGAAEGDS